MYSAGKLVVPGNTRVVLPAESNVTFFNKDVMITEYVDKPLLSGIIVVPNCRKQQLLPMM